MTHLATSGVGTTEAVTNLSTLSTVQSFCSGPPHSRQLDKRHIASGIASRRQRLASLETELVAACEQAASRYAPPRSVEAQNRETWDKPMWQRYLAAAACLEPQYGPPMRKLLQEIDQLQRLAELPLVA